MVEEAERATLVRGEPKEIRFKKWIKDGHLRPLYIKAHVNRKPANKVLIDRGAVLSVMPYSMVKR